MRRVFAVASLALIPACRSTGANAASGDAPPAALLGEFVDDYDTRYRISAKEFVEGRSVYQVLEWRPKEQYFLARNADSNRTDGGKFSRFDWLMLPDQGAYTWGYCHSAWKAPTVDSARATLVVDRGVPRVGCNRNPFTRMKGGW